MLSSDLGQKQIAPSAIFGGNTVKEAADIFVDIINGKGTEAQNNVVLTNAAFALKTFNKNKRFEIAFEEAKDSLLGLRAKECLNKLITN